MVAGLDLTASVAWWLAPDAAFVDNYDNLDHWNGQGPVVTALVAVRSAALLAVAGWIGSSVWTAARLSPSEDASSGPS